VKSDFDRLEGRLIELLDASTSTLPACLPSGARQQFQKCQKTAEGNSEIERDTVFWIDPRSDLESAVSCNGSNDDKAEEARYMSFGQ
jgi:hypothetical protein